MSQARLYPDAPDWNQIKAIEVNGEPKVVATEYGQVLQLSCGYGKLFISFYDNVVRIHSHLTRENDYGLVSLPDETNALELQQRQDRLRVISGNTKLEIQTRPFAFNVTRLDAQCRSASDGHFVRRFRLPPLAKTEQGWMINFDLHSNEAIYGLGEKWAGLNKRGQLLRSYNSDALGVNAEISYKNKPFCWSPDGWGVLFNTPAPVTHAIGYPAWSQRAYSALVEDENFDCLILLADAVDNKGADILRHYAKLTSFAPMPPSWSGGVILSKAYYQDAAEILSVAQEVRARNMPCDVITFDGRAWQDTRTRFSFSWDETRYPDPKPVIDELKSLGFKICIWEYPLISTENAWFKEFADKGWLLKDQRTGEAYEFEWDRQAFGDVLTELPRSGLVDFTHQDAYDFWREAHRQLFELGVDMIKADFGEQVEDYAIASNGEKGKALHNVYAYLYNRCVFEAAEKYAANGPFLFSRASWIACQKFNSQWGGDPQADWEGMAANLRGGLSWGLSGAPFYATDVGGFYKDTRDDKLYVRWAQAAVFSAHYRLHGIGAREPWTYSPAAEQAVMQALELRYRLQAYLQRSMLEATQTALPVQRAMVLAFPQDKASWAFENQFMFGSQMLVAPCISASSRVEVYLPAAHSTWVQFRLDDKPGIRLAGGSCHQLELELDEMAVFVAEDAQIPLNKPATNTADLEITDDGLFAIEEYWSASL